MTSCTYRFKNASGEEVTITGQADMKAFLANGGLEQLLPGKVLPWGGKQSTREKYSGPIDVSSRDGQMELANRAGTIAVLKGMNAQLRAIDPGEAWADSNIEQSSDLDALRDQISVALVKASRGKQQANPLRKRLEEASGQELKAVFDVMGLAGARMLHGDRVDALMAEDAKAVSDALDSILSAEPPKADPESKPSTITDFGEKIGGARKDAQASAAKEWSDDEIASQPFSKVWPAADIGAIEDPFVAAVMFAARAEVPAKPRVAYKVKAWVEKIKMFRDLVARVAGDVGRDRYLEKMKGYGRLDGFRAKVTLLEALERSQWKRIGAVAEYPDAYAFNDGKKTLAPQVSVEIDGRRERFEGSGSVLDALDKINEKLGVAAEPKKMQFEVRGREGMYSINKKGDKEYRRLKTFTSTKEAFAYMESNYADLVAAWDGVKDRDNVGKADVRNETNRPRTGSDYRDELSKSRVLDALIDSSNADAKFVRDLLIRQAGFSHSNRLFNIPSPFGFANWPNLPGGVNAKTRERPSYMAAVSIHLLRNLSEAESFGVELLGERNVPLITAVQEAMIALGHDHKVFGAIVERIPIDVMDFLSKKKISAESLFSDKSVLKSLFPIDGGVSIGAGGRDNPIVRLVREIARSGAEIVRADDPARIALENDSALLAGQVDSGLEKSLFSHDVAPEEFDRTFSFKGVQFGNWVSQGAGGKDRQGMLNQAYDALMDLANIAGIPPKAVSLNGSLGLAFGSRGNGWASAHFEPDKLVINLTKTRGAGTLAHEWFHALDNYFSRQRGGEVRMRRGINAQEAYRTQNFITYRPEPMYVHKTKQSAPVTKAQLDRYHAQAPESGYYNPENWQIDPSHPQGVRPEVERAFADLVETLDNSPMKARSAKNDKGAGGYWSRIIERGARSFENYVIHKMRMNGYDNDYLANVRKVDDFARDAGRYPYLLDEEVAPVAEAFDALFSEIKTKETEQGVALYEIDENGDPSPEEAEAVQRGLEGKNPIEAAAWLAENAPLKFAVIAEKVRDKLQSLSDAGVRLGMAIIRAGDIGESALIGARGVTSPSFANGRQSITVAINGADMKGRVGTSYRTALHELVHAATLQPLDQGRKGHEKYAEAYRDLDDVGYAVVAHLNERIKTPESLTEFERALSLGRANFLDSPFEVIAWALSSHDAQAYLESIPYKSKSLWTAFVEAVRKVLGLKPGADTALSEVLRISDILLKPEREGWPGRVPLPGDSHYEIQQPGGGRIFKNPGGRPETNWADAPAVLRDTSALRDGESIPRDQAEAFIRSFVAEFPGAPPIMLADSFSQLPKDLQADAISQGSSARRAKGALKDGKAFVVLNNHHSMADLEATVFHEILGHTGIRKLLGPQFSQELNKLFVGLGGYSGLERIMEARGMGQQFEGYFRGIQQARASNPDAWTDALAKSILTEEVFAHIAEQKNAKQLRDRFMALVGMVRDWLRKHGFMELARLGESDIVFMLQHAREGLRDGSGIVRDGATVGENEIVGEDGRPIAKEGSPEYEALKLLSGRLGLRERSGPTVFKDGLRDDGNEGQDAGMDDTNNVAGKQAPNPTGDVEQGSATPAPAIATLKSAPMFGTTVTVEKNGVVSIAWAGWGDTRTYLRDKAINAVMEEFKPKLPDGVFWRFTNNKSEASLAAKKELRPSTDHSSNTQEEGLSVTDGAHYSVFGYKYGYQVRGEVIGYGADGEPLLDVATLEPVTKTLNSADIVKLDSKSRIDALKAKGWTVEQYKAFANGTFKLHDIDKDGPLPNEQSTSARPDVAVFRTDTYAQPRGQAAKGVMDNVLSAFKDPSSKVFGTLHTKIATQLHKAWVNKDYGKVFHLADSYERDISRFSADPSAAAPNLLPAFDNIRDAFNRLAHGNANRKHIDGVADAIFSGTLAGEDVTEGRVWNDRELRDEFGMNDEQIGLYHESRNAIDASLDATAAGLAWQSVKKYIPDMKDSVKAEAGNAETIIDGAMRDLEEELREVAQYQATVEAEGALPEGTAAKTLKKAKDVAEARQAAESIFVRADTLKTAGYAPLMRFGRFAVDVVENLPDGTQERIGFYKFETEIEAKMSAQKLQKDHPGAEVTRSVMSEEAWKIFKGVDPDLVAMFAETLDGIDGLDVKGEVLQEWYRSAVNDRSSFKRMIHRKGTEGFDRDLTRVVASFITSNARVAARQFNMGDMAQAIADMQDRKVSGDVVDEAVRLKEYMENPTEPFQGLKGWMFAWFLGGSVASAVLNLTQPLMMTLPYLSQFGITKAGAELAKAAKEAATNNVEDAELKRALLRASKDGKVDPQQVHHLYHEGMRPFLSKLPIGEAMRDRAQGLMTMWGYMFGATENFNRRITFIAAYRMARDNPELGNPYEFAVKAIDETQGIYSKANRPNWARGTGPFGAVGVAAFTFKQYSVGYVELLIRMAKSGKNGRIGAAMMLGALVMMSGMQGAPGADDLEDIIDTVSQYLGYTGNSRLGLRNYLRSLLGDEAAKIVMYGGLSALPFDIAGRVGLGNLLPATAIFKPSEQNRASQFAELFGPPLSMSNQVLDAALAMESGSGVGGVANAFAPVAIRNLMKAYDMAESGEYRDGKGRKVTNVSMMDAMYKAGGLQPMGVSAEQKNARLVQMTGERIKQVKGAINSLKARGIVENDQAKRAKADELLKAWNESNPDARIMPDGASVLRRVKEMNTERRARLMKALPREYRQVAEGEMN